MWCGTSGVFEELCEIDLEGVVADLEGYFYKLEFYWEGDYCHGSTRMGSTELVRYNAEGETVVAHIEDVCDPTPNCEWVKARPYGAHTTALEFTKRPAALRFAPETGSMYVTWTSASFNCDGAGYGYRMALIQGFVSIYDLSTTYRPNALVWGFTVPYMPEGFRAASYFDTYYGDLATVGDGSKAQPLQCGYPATAPHVGVYLTVADPLPDPPLNHGRYYFTAVSYMGATRYGRKSSGGVLTGRDPALLPVCE